MPFKTVLFVLTSCNKLNDGRPTGWYLPEAAHPYYALKGHVNIIFASPAGGEAPLDPTSAKNFTDNESVRFKDGAEERALWTNTRKLSEIKASDLEAIFIVGGHGPVVDLAVDKDLARLIADLYDAKKPVTAVCHGPAALLSAVTHKTVPDLLRDVKVTGFSDSEEVTAGYASYPDVLPFSTEQGLSGAGGKYEKAKEDWAPHVVWDKGILTGQNPASAAPLGQKLKEILA
ncbi:hypothetical protein Q5752_006419 [Cryptotrichosporon argae]